MRKTICKYLIMTVLALIANKQVMAETETESQEFSASSFANSYILPDSIIASHQHFKISYRVDRYDLDSAYMANSDNIRRMRVTLGNTVGIDSIVVYSFASPEGPLKNNIRLARMRGNTSKKLIQRIIEEQGQYLSEDKIILRTRGENWEDLRTIVENTYNEDNRDRLLEILDSDMSQDAKKRAIRRLGNKTWRFVIDKIMPHLRSAEIVCVYRTDMAVRRLDMPVAEMKLSPLEPSMGIGSMSEEAGYDDGYERHTRVAVKTNMLYDAVTWVNFSIEAPFKINDHKFSVTYDHQFPWWRWGKHNNEYSNRYLQIGGEVRWWFAPQNEAKTKKKILRDCLAGHFVGFYFMGGKYDFQWQRDICYQGEFWSTGVTYGFAMPISSLFNLEFSVSAGFAPITYRHYIPADDYSILFIDRSKIGTKNYLGVTKAAISLVMPLKFKQKITRNRK